MQTQTPFPPEQHTNFIRPRGFTRPEHTRWDRFEKVEFIEETSTLTRHDMFNELLGWMNEEEFNKFYDTFCSNWSLARDYEELDKTGRMTNEKKLPV